MANVAHSTLTGSNLHETKGMASATDDYVLTATSGAGVYKKLTAINLTGTGNPFGGQLFHIRDQKTSGTVGQTLTATSWNTRVLQTSVTNEISSASLSSNQISLPAGTYFIMGDAVYGGVGGATNYGILRLRNITGSTTLVDGGTPGYYSIGSASNNLINNSIKGRFTLAGTTTIELQHYVSNAGTMQPLSISSTPEVYADILIWKVG